LTPNRRPSSCRASTKEQGRYWHDTYTPPSRGVARGGAKDLSLALANAGGSNEHPSHWGPQGTEKTPPGAQCSRLEAPVENGRRKTYAAGHSHWPQPQARGHSQRPEARASGHRRVPCSFLTFFTASQAITKLLVAHARRKAGRVLASITDNRGVLCALALARPAVLATKRDNPLLYPPPTHIQGNPYLSPALSPLYLYPK
jgi:hypothetical protein